MGPINVIDYQTRLQVSSTMQRRQDDDCFSSGGYQGRGLTKPYRSFFLCAYTDQHGIMASTLVYYGPDFRANLTILDERPVSNDVYNIFDL